MLTNANLLLKEYWVRNEQFSSLIRISVLKKSSKIEITSFSLQNKEFAATTGQVIFTFKWKHQHLEMTQQGSIFSNIKSNPSEDP